jgi:ABC-type sulfate/molybdate transport systems ATPase subunit
MPEPWIDVEVALQLGPRKQRIHLRGTTQVLGIVGPSGCGKTTLLRVIAGVETRAVGVVRALGEVWQAPGQFVPAWRRGVGWVPQDALLLPHLTNLQNLEYAGRSTREETLEVARLLGVVEDIDRSPRHMSGGERQRVALGRALLGKPRILLLDEPFSALDPALRNRLRVAIAERIKQGPPAVLVTHDERDLEAFEAQRIEVSAT